MAKKIIKKWITPPEAYSIAAEFDRSAKEAEELANHLANVRGTLDSTWEGNSKNNFMSGFNGEPGKIRSYADYLRQSANQIRSIKVEVTEIIDVPDTPRPFGGGGGGSW